MLYAQRGRFARASTPQIIQPRPEPRRRRVRDHRGPPTLISRIAFVGNHAFGESRLRDVIESRQDAWWRFLSTSDEL